MRRACTCATALAQSPVRPRQWPRLVHRQFLRLCPPWLLPRRSRLREARKRALRPHLRHWTLWQRSVHKLPRWRLRHRRRRPSPCLRAPLCPPTQSCSEGERKRTWPGDRSRPHRAHGRLGDSAPLHPWRRRTRGQLPTGSTTRALSGPTSTKSPTSTRRMSGASATSPIAEVITPTTSPSTRTSSPTASSPSA